MCAVVLVSSVKRKERTPGLGDGGGGGVWQGPGEEEKVTGNRSDAEACEAQREIKIRVCQRIQEGDEQTRGLARREWNGDEEGWKAFCR